VIKRRVFQLARFINQKSDVAKQCKILKEYWIDAVMPCDENISSEVGSYLYATDVGIFCREREEKRGMESGAEDPARRVATYKDKSIGFVGTFGGDDINDVLYAHRRKISKLPDESQKFKIQACFYENGNIVLRDVTIDKKTVGIYMVKKI
jgi:hypothetical protein